MLADGFSYNLYHFNTNHAVLLSSSRHPITKWAQRKDKIYLEVQLRDISNENIELTNTTLTFVGDSDGQKYSFAFEFFEEVDKEASKWNKTGFHLLFVLEKKDQDAPFWARLLKTKEKNQYIQVDWSKWVDEDEEPEEGNKGLGGFDPSQMQSNISFYIRLRRSWRIPRWSWRLSRRFPRRIPRRNGRSRRTIRWSWRLLARRGGIRGGGRDRREEGRARPRLKLQPLMLIAHMPV